MKKFLLHLLLPLLLLASAAFSAEVPVKYALNVKGPSGTNFGWGSRDLKLEVILDANPPTPTKVKVTSYWVAYDGRKRNAAVCDAREVTVSATQPAKFSTSTEATRNNGTTDTVVIRPGAGGSNTGANRGAAAPNGYRFPDGVYRGWVVTVQDEKGAHLTTRASSPEFEKLVGVEQRTKGGLHAPSGLGKTPSL